MAPPNINILITHGISLSVYKQLRLNGPHGSCSITPPTDKNYGCSRRALLEQSYLETLDSSWGSQSDLLLYPTDKSKWNNTLFLSKGMLTEAVSVQAILL